MSTSASLSPPSFQVFRLVLTFSLLDDNGWLYLNKRVGLFFHTIFFQDGLPCVPLLSPPSRPLLCGNQATLSGEMWVTFRGMGSIRRPRRSHWAPLFALTSDHTDLCTVHPAYSQGMVQDTCPDCCIIALFTVSMRFIFPCLELRCMAATGYPPLSTCL